MAREGLLDYSTVILLSYFTYQRKSNVKQISIEMTIFRVSVRVLADCRVIMERCDTDWQGHTTLTVESVGLV